MPNRPSEIILEPSFEEKLLAELNRRFDAVYQEVAEFLTECGYTEEQIDNFFQQAQGMANFQMH